MWAALIDESDVTEYASVKLKPAKTTSYGYVFFIRYAGNRAEKIIAAVEKFFNVTLISEYKDEFYNIIVEPEIEED